MTALLAIIAVLLGFVLRELRRSSRLLQALLAQSAPRDVSSGKDLESAHFEARSIHEQSARILLDNNWRLRAIEGTVRYLRSYVWEVADPRYIDDVKHGKESSFLKRRFPSRDDTSEYNLWLREQDIDEGFDRDIRKPSLEREQAAREAEARKSAESESAPGPT